jgi:predicted fused transcriptional regulator/phosphomethylpyrimidine kinase
LSTVKDTLGSVKENVRKYVNTIRHKEENLEDIPEVESN